MGKKIALFHPWIKSRGGAEKTVLEIVRNLKNVDLYTWVYDRENTFEEFKEYEIKVIAPKIAQKLARTYLLRGLFLPLSLFSKIPLKKYDLFLISTSGVGEFINFRNYKPKKTYGYIYTPLRDASEEIVKWHMENKYKNIFSKLIYLFAVKNYRVLEKISWKRIDFPIFISELSRERAIKRNLIKNKSQVIYPPIDIDNFSKLKTKKGDYFLYVSRFNPPKRQDILIKAWKKFVEKNPHQKLILAGNIENKKYFEKVKKLANETKNIEIKTNLNEKEIMDIYANCYAVVFVPFMEDFGIVPFEALATGKPLIAMDKGGYVKLITKNQQFYPIREGFTEQEMIKNINETLENFIKSKNIPKKIKLDEFSSKSFINKIEKVFTQ